jgi:hypothetical protein
VQVGPDGSVALRGVVTVVDHAQGRLDEEEANNNGSEDRVVVSVYLFSTVLVKRASNSSFYKFIK